MESEVLHINAGIVYAQISLEHKSSGSYKTEHLESKIIQKEICKRVNRHRLLKEIEFSYRKS